MYEKSEKVLTIIAVVLLLIVIAVTCYSVYTNQRIKQDNYHVNESMDRAEEVVDRTGKRLDASQKQVEQSQNELDRAAETGRAIAKSADRSTAILNDSQSIIDRMSARSTRIKAVIGEIEAGNQADGAQTESIPPPT